MSLLSCHYLVIILINNFATLSLSGTASPRITSAADQDKRPCSTVGNLSRSVPVARSDGSEYLASCAYQSSTDYNARDRDSVVPTKPFCENTSGSSGGNYLCFLFEYRPCIWHDKGHLAWQAFSFYRCYVSVENFSRVIEQWSEADSCLLMMRAGSKPTSKPTKILLYNEYVLR